MSAWRTHLILSGIPVLLDGLFVAWAAQRTGSDYGAGAMVFGVLCACTLVYWLLPSIFVALMRQRTRDSVLVAHFIALAIFGTIAALFVG